MKPVLILCFCVILSKSVKLPPNFRKCNRKQPDLDQCVFEAAKHSISQLNHPYKSLNIPSLDPLEISEMSAHVETRLINMKERLIDCKFFNLMDAKVEKFVFDLNKKIISGTLFFPDLRTHCHFKINGKILFVPIDGEGPSALHFKNLNISFNATYNEVKRKNKTYAKIESVRVDGRPDNVHFQLDNIINGDKEQSDFMNKLLNDNWSELFDDIKDVYFRLGDQLMFQLLNGLFSKLSLEEAFD